MQEVSGGGIRRAGCSEDSLEGALQNWGLRGGGRGLVWGARAGGRGGGKRDCLPKRES